MYDEFSCTVNIYCLGRFLFVDTMNNMNLFSLLYLFYRLSSFIIVSFFALGPLINGDIKGFVYLIGLAFGLLVTTIFANTFSSESQEPRHVICDAFSMNAMVNHKYPVSLAILTYTFFYLVFPIAKYQLELYNIPTLIGFPLLILSDIIWNTKYGCFDMVKCAMVIIIGAAWGVSYSALIDSLKLPKLLYVSSGSDRQMCSKPSKQKFRCYVKK